PDTPAAMERLLGAANITPPVRMQHADASPVTDVEARLFANGSMQLLALHRDWSRARTEPETIVLTLAAKRFVRDLRGGDWSFTDTLTITLDAVAPTLLALSSERQPSPTVIPGEQELRVIGAPGEVVHLDFIGADGAVAPGYSGNVVLRDGSAEWSTPHD